MDDPDDLTPDASHPQADVTLPNGQHLQASVIRRHRDRSGVWWYDREIELPDRVDDRRAGPALTSRTVSFSAPHPHAPTNRVGAPVIYAVNGTYRAYHRCDQAVIVTTSTFTPDAQRANAELDVPLRLVDGRALGRWVSGGRPPWGA
ncbi:restriction endonuclease [Streptomyces sioyaensis]|uniref:restriction endonuclease n=1 Tax=Streptomyces sioyaensis TaxID=67364 RepID=UPI0037D7194D